MLRMIGTTTASKVRALADRMRRSADGVAAIEFAMVVPLMFFMLVGAVEFSQAITVDRRVTQIASATADIVARAPSEGVTAAQVDRDLSIASQLMAPYELSQLNLAIISIKAQSVPGNPNALNYIVDWSRDNKGGTPYARGSVAPFGMPQNLLVSGESVIVGHAVYNYKPLIFNYFIREAFNLEEKFYLKPRNSSCVHLRPINCVTGSTM